MEFHQTGDASPHELALLYTFFRYRPAATSVNAPASPTRQDVFGEAGPTDRPTTAAPRPERPASTTKTLAVSSAPPSVAISTTAAEKDFDAEQKTTESAPSDDDDWRMAESFIWKNNVFKDYPELKDLSSDTLLRILPRIYASSWLKFVDEYKEAKREREQMARQLEAERAKRVAQPIYWNFL